MTGPMIDGGRVTTDTVVEVLARRSVVAVIRVASVGDPLAIVDALSEGGVTVVEFTFTSSDVAEAIELTRCERPDVIVGAGTIRTEEQLLAASDAGAQFGVSPHLMPVLVERAQRIGLPYVPGALTPSELAHALALGSEMVKLYPASVLGPKRVADLRAVFPEAALMVTGGISVGDAASYVQAGASVVGLGGSLIADALTGGDLGGLTERARRLTATLAVAPAP